jgi:hypothetical protein
VRLESVEIKPSLGFVGQRGEMSDPVHVQEPFSFEVMSAVSAH